MRIQLRGLLTTNFALSPQRGEGHIGYANPFLIRPENRETHPLKKIEPALVRKGVTTILIREYDQTLEWSVVCLGYLVGSVWAPLRSPLLKGDVQPRGGIRLVVARGRLEPELLSPIRSFSPPQSDFSKPQTATRLDPPLKAHSPDSPKP